MTRDGRRSPRRSLSSVGACRGPRLPIEPDRRLAGERLPAFDDDLAVPRLELQAVAPAAVDLGGDQGRARPKERVVHRLTGA